MLRRNHATPFLDKLDSAEELNDVGLYLFNQFMSTIEAEDAFQTLNHGMPCQLKPTLYGEKLPQHAYHHIRRKKTTKQGKESAGLLYLEELCNKIEEEFDGKVSDVYCNRFSDPYHHITYHTDTFGRHIMVLSLGSQRAVNFRHKKTKEVTGVRPNSGDVYFMPIRVNDSYEHCVCAANHKDDFTGNEEPRLSFVFFFETPRYAKDFKISTSDKIFGFIEGYLAG